MRRLPNELLIRTYHQANELNLHPDFLELLYIEITKRSLECYIIGPCYVETTKNQLSIRKHSFLNTQQSKLAIVKRG